MNREQPIKFASTVIEFMQFIVCNMAKGMWYTVEPHFLMVGVII